jgi:succinate dehydrogenase / fumarate reductase cytochrome b subunit
MDRSWFRRFHSIAGVIPLGAFLAFHLTVNSSARGGPDAYNATVHRLQHLPLLGIVEIVCLLAPLAFHAVGGLFLIATVPVASEHPTRAGDGAVLQRAGVLLFAFLLFHLWTARLMQLEDQRPGPVPPDAVRPGQPVDRILYVGGILAAAGHFAAGLALSRRPGASRGPRTRTAVAVLQSRLPRPRGVRIGSRRGVPASNPV